jgi:hypothetical protein
MNGPGEANAAIHKATAKGDKVTQDIAVSVKGDQVTCSINGTVVGTYAKADLVVPENSSHSTGSTASGSRTIRKAWSRASRRLLRRAFCSALKLKLMLEAGPGLPTRDAGSGASSHLVEISEAVTSPALSMS